MIEVNLIVSETKKMGVVDDLRYIQQYRMQPIMSRGPHEAVAPIDDVQYDKYEINKMIIKGEPVYYAMDADMKELFDKVVGAYREDANNLFGELTIHKQKLMAARLQLDAQTKSAKTAWETYYENILFLLDAPFLTRMKFLFKGKMY